MAKKVKEVLKRGDFAKQIDHIGVCENPYVIIISVNGGSVVHIHKEEGVEKTAEYDDFVKISEQEYYTETRYEIPTKS